MQELTYTQFLSQHFGVFLGKINAIAPTNVLHGDYTTGFQNTGITCHSRSPWFRCRRMGSARCTCPRTT